MGKPTMSPIIIIIFCKVVVFLDVEYPNMGILAKEKLSIYSKNYYFKLIQS
jgi:hypothetical protein